MLLLVLVSCFMLAGPARVQAKDLFANPRHGVCRSGADTSSSAVCTDNKSIDPNPKKAQDPFSGKRGLLARITDIVAYIAGGAAIILILVSALRYVTAGGDISTGARDDNDVRDAKRTIANALIGLVIIVLAHTIIVFVIKKL